MAHAQVMEKTTQNLFNAMLPATSDVINNENAQSQYYVIRKGNIVFGYIFAEINTWDGMRHKPCAVHWISPATKRLISVQTIGAGDYETVECNHLEAVGIVRKNTQDLKSFDVAFLYSADSPNAHINAPVIMTYDALKGRFFLNESLSGKAEGATLDAVRKSVSH